MEKPLAQSKPKSPAQRHKERILAAKQAAATNPENEQTGSAYELTLLQLNEHRKALKNIQSTENKVKLKHELVPQYDDYIAGVLEAGQGAQDAVLTTLLVWNLDIGKFDLALSIAEYALEHDLQLPDQYNRNIATLLLDEVSEAFLKADVEDIEAAIITLGRVRLLTLERDAPDQARAKLHKAIGLLLLEKIGDGDLTKETEADAESAEEHLKRAVALHDKVGVKKDIESLERKLKKLRG